MIDIEEIEFETKNPKPTYLWLYNVENHKDINSKIINTVTQHRTDNPEGYRDYINVDVWQTHWNMEDEPGFDKIADIAKNICTTISEKHFNFPKFFPKIVDCWSNVYMKESGCRVHQHFPAIFSLVYYVSAPEGTGKIFFPDLEIGIQPYEGLLLCFRGDTWHGVEFNKTEQERIVVAFNMICDLQT
jgi:hypothetical protein